MSLTIANVIIQRVLIVDDDPKARLSYGDSIEELGLQPIYEPGPLHNVDELRGKADAVVCDYRLRIRNFSQCDGDQLVVSLNQIGLPALLCTTYTDSDITVMRSKRRFIPALLTPNTYNPDTIRRGFERCIRESAGTFDPSRRPWRTLVRVVDVEQSGGYFYVVVPGWSVQQKIRMYLSDVPSELKAQIQPSGRFHAQVNIGAKAAEELYFSDWEGR